MRISVRDLRSIISEELSRTLTETYVDYATASQGASREGMLAVIRDAGLVDANVIPEEAEEILQMMMPVIASIQELARDLGTDDSTLADIIFRVMGSHWDAA